VSTKQKQATAEHLRDNMTWPEKILWSRLRRRQIGYSFQPQAIVRGYIADFWCPAAQVVIEVDGKHHNTPQRIEDDKRRDEFLMRNGIRVLRFSVSDVMKGMSAVLIRVWNTCNDRAPHAERKPAPLLEGENSHSRPCESLEKRGLQNFRTAKMQDSRAAEFSARYRERHSNFVGKRWKPHGKTGN